MELNLPPLLMSRELLEDSNTSMGEFGTQQSLFVNDEKKKWKDYYCPESSGNYYYSITKAGIELIGEKESFTVSRTPFILCAKTEPLVDGTAYYTIRHGREQKEFLAKESDLLIKNSLKTVLTSHSINVPDNKILNQALEYISMCIAGYGDNLKIIKVAESNGWNEDYSLFALGETGITGDGETPIKTLVTDSTSFHKKGTLDEWVKTVTPIMGYDLSRFDFYDAMTAPLKKLLKIESHTLVHHGATTRGKTAQENVISSAIGNPQKLEFLADSTKNAILAYVAAMNDIPVDLEEATDPKAREVLASAVYDIANGKDKGRCTIEGKLRKDIKTFRTAVHVTCESPLRENLNNAGAAYRTGQIGDLLPDGLGDMISKVKRGIQDNYGFFFPLYVQKIISNKSRLEDLYEEALEKIESACDDLSPESKSIVERSKFIYAGTLVAGWLCEEVFQDIQLPSKSKEEVVKIVNHYFKMCVISEPVEPDWVRALRVINDWTVTEARKFDSDYYFDLKYELLGKITDKFIDIIGTEFTKKMKDCGFSPTAIKKALLENGITVCTSARKDGNCTVTVNRKGCAGIRIVRDNMAKKLHLNENRRDEYSEKVLDTVIFICNKRGSASLQQVQDIVGYSHQLGVSTEKCLEGLELDGHITVNEKGEYVSNVL